MATADAIAALQQRFADVDFAPRPLMRYLDGRDSDQIAVRVTPDRLLEAMRFLRNDERTKFEQLCDVTCVDYLNYPAAEDRFAVVYSLLSHTHNPRLWVKVFLNDPDPTVPSVTCIWKGANWREREQFDMFGITFTGHPDLRRILCEDYFEDHPLRKDYPLRGKGERENFTVVTRDSEI
ncbi:MAG: NADH-quinone oxidoreductase subunit C [Phycisphaerae bacterium]|nr:NADH-quinone oxidoreductase subunit C [Phycisphaerae bacterium]